MAVFITQCRPGNPKTGIYAQKVLNQSGSCQAFAPKPLLLIGVTHDPATLNFIAPLPDGGGVPITIPPSGGTTAVCDGNVIYEARVAELGDTTITLDLYVTWDAKGSMACPTLASDPALSCQQSVEMQYTFQTACEAPCIGQEYWSHDSNGAFVQTAFTCDCTPR